MGDSARMSFRGRSTSGSESSKGNGRLGEALDWLTACRVAFCAARMDGSIVGADLGFVCLAGEMMGLMAVGSKVLSTNRLEKRAREGSSGNRSLIRFSSFMIWVNSP